MGACISTQGPGAGGGGGETGSPSADQVKHHKEIEKGLKDDERRMAKEVKILLLGAGESGKTTVLKQMKILHERGFTPTEREHYRQQVFANLVNSMNSCFDAMARSETHFADASLLDVVPLFEQGVDVSPGQPFPPQFLEILRRLWADGGVQTIIGRANEFGLPENMHYFFPDLDRLFSSSYSPTDQDVLQTRGKTTGIVETLFRVGDLSYRLFDVGGQRSERKKWIHCFENVTAVLFLVAISGYDQCLIEDKDANQMQEALVLFENICNSRWFTSTSMILFLNKADLFKRKLTSSPVSKYFPDYEGENGDYEAARTFFKMRFVRLNRSERKDIYTHTTCATDTQSFKVVMASVTDIIITRNLAAIIL